VIRKTLGAGLKRLVPGRARALGGGRRERDACRQREREPGRTAL